MKIKTMAALLLLAPPIAGCAPAVTENNIELAQKRVRELRRELMVIDPKIQPRSWQEADEASALAKKYLEKADREFSSYFHKAETHYFLALDNIARTERILMEIKQNEPAP